MKISTSSILQALTWIASAGVLYSNEVPKKFQPYLIAASGIASLLLHLYAGVHDQAGNQMTNQALAVNASSAASVKAAEVKEGL